MTSDALRDRLGYAFRRPELLAQALTHRSFGAQHNERLEFVGDAVLNCAIAAVLYRRFPQIPEGDLSRVRASLVNRDTLAELARALGVGDAVRLGEGEHRSGGAATAVDPRRRARGRVRRDLPRRGLRRRRHGVIESRLSRRCSRISIRRRCRRIPKTRLQEWLQARRIAVPDYVVTDVAGDAHAQTFTVECRIPSLSIVAVGAGASRRAAEQAAASVAYAEATAVPGIARRG